MTEHPFEAGARVVSLAFPCGDFADEALGVVDRGTGGAGRRFRSRPPAGRDRAPERRRPKHPNLVAPEHLAILKWLEINQSKSP